MEKVKYATGSSARIDLPMPKTDGSFSASGDWTPAGGDVKIRKDGGAEANIATLPTATGHSWTFPLSDGEVTCKGGVVTIHGVSGLQDNGFRFETYGHPSAMYPTDFGAADISGTVVSGGTRAGFVSNRTETDDDYWLNCIVLFTSGTISGQSQLITGYNGTTKAFTFASPGFSRTIPTSATFIIVNR